MKFFLALAAVAVAMSAPTTTASSAAAAAKTGLRRSLDGTLAPAGPSTSNQMCLSTGETPLSKTKVALLQGLATRVVHGAKTAVTAGARGVDPPKYVFGCSWYDFDCYVCDLCQDFYGLLLETGSEPACAAICAVTAEGAGGGPEDPVADAVALDCAALCEAIFSAAGDGTALGACSFADLC